MSTVSEVFLGPFWRIGGSVFADMAEVKASDIEERIWYEGDIAKGTYMALDKQPRTTLMIGYLGPSSHPGDIHRLLGLMRRFNVLPWQMEGGVARAHVIPLDAMPVLMATPRESKRDDALSSSKKAKSTKKTWLKIPRYPFPVLSMNKEDDPRSESEKRASQDWRSLDAPILREFSDRFIEQYVTSGRIHLWLIPESTALATTVFQINKIIDALAFEIMITKKPPMLMVVDDADDVEHLERMVAGTDPKKYKWSGRDDDLFGYMTKAGMVSIDDNKEHITWSPRSVSNFEIHVLQEDGKDGHIKATINWMYSQLPAVRSAILTNETDGLLYKDVADLVAGYGGKLDGETKEDGQFKGLVIGVLDTLGFLKGYYDFNYMYEILANHVSMDVRFVHLDELPVDMGNKQTLTLPPRKYDYLLYTEAEQKRLADWDALPAKTKARFFTRFKQQYFDKQDKVHAWVISRRVANLLDTAGFNDATSQESKFGLDDAVLLSKQAPSINTMTIDFDGGLYSDNGPRSKLVKENKESGIRYIKLAGMSYSMPIFITHSPYGGDLPPPDIDPSDAAIGKWLAEWHPMVRKLRQEQRSREIQESTPLYKDLADLASGYTGRVKLKPKPITRHSRFP
jgi:hypothetical protein